MRAASGKVAYAARVGRAAAEVTKDRPPALGVQGGALDAPHRSPIIVNLGVAPRKGAVALARLVCTVVGDPEYPTSMHVTRGSVVSEKRWWLVQSTVQ